MKIEGENLNGIMILPDFAGNPILGLTVQNQAVGKLINPFALIFVAEIYGLGKLRLEAAVTHREFSIAAARRRADEARNLVDRHRHRDRAVKMEKLGRPHPQADLVAGESLAIGIKWHMGNARQRLFALVDEFAPIFRAPEISYAGKIVKLSGNPITGRVVRRGKIA